MLILQIADRTGAPVGPMTVPALRPYTEKRMFLKDRVKKGGVDDRLSGSIDGMEP